MHGSIIAQDLTKSTDAPIIFLYHEQRIVMFNPLAIDTINGAVGIVAPVRSMSVTQVVALGVAHQSNSNCRGRYDWDESDLSGRPLL